MVKLLLLNQTNYTNYSTMKIKINNTIINTEIADTNSKQILGLSGRKNLNQNSGMIFIYNKPDYYGIWMKDMNFPIDIIWINENKKIIDITKNVSPKTYPQVFKSTSQSKYIIEVNANFSTSNNIKTGDSVDFKS
jgi:uncharacterized membrane protein (UPF0127 family)